ncbi:hypothetical protein QGN29_01880 [Temperatibacter marinus]|uniref:Uncharacterized protein n=1 Tax=Temperatibacter marinus TaxID=1456591 RepID=A0AA52H9N9_9PROT|nr:hypothetical protein [Temperatibacter marinus]WND03114.1 hypothetical protein QGN29_01880 [Temperatibacter marinus]
MTEVPQKMTVKGHLKVIGIAVLFSTIVYSAVKIIYQIAEHFGLNG